MSDGMTLESIQQLVVVSGRIAAVVELTPRTTLTTPSAASSRASMGLAATIVTDVLLGLGSPAACAQDTAGVHLLAFFVVVSNLAQLLSHSLSRSSCSAMLCRHPSTRDVRVD
jgi:hypothetical protein